MTADIHVGQQLRHDRSNLTAGFDWAATTNQWTPAGELLLGSLAAYENFGHCGEAVALFGRCERPLNDTDPELADFIRASILWALVIFDDWITTRRVAQQLLDSPDPRVRTFGCGWLSFLYGMTAPAAASAYREQGARHLAIALAEHPGLNTDIAHGHLLVQTAFDHAFWGDYDAALAAIDEHPNLLARHDHVGGLELARHSQAAMCDLLLGEPTKALDRLDPFDDVTYAYGSEHHEIRALVHLELGDIDTARSHVRAYAIEAATGRLSRQCNDAVLILAALAQAEGDNDTATDLVLHMGVGRMPSTIWYATDFAQRLGTSDEFANYLLVVRDPANRVEHGVLGARTAMATLRTELARRGWA